jgi:hypothetical protein
MNRRALQAVVVAILVAVAFALRGRGPVPQTPMATPEAAVNALFDAAGRGDDEAYLRLVAGDLRKSLLDTRAQLGARKFRENLKRSAAGVKGIAVTRRQDAPPGLVALDVELVFADRNERQRVLLARKGNGWVITALGPAEASKPAIPYGTPVFEE